MLDYEPEIDVFDYMIDENEWIRVFAQDDGWHSATYLAQDKRNELVFTYMKKFTLMFEMKKDIRDVLMIGGGTFSYPKYVISHYPDVFMDVVEMNPVCIRYAMQYFFLDELIDTYHLNENHRLNTIEAEGRAYMEQCGKKYDVIINDAYTGTFPAYELASLEALQTMKHILKEDGIYLANMPGFEDLSDSRFLLAEIKTLKKLFEYVLLVPAPGGLTEGTMCNYVVIASDCYDRAEGMIRYHTGTSRVLTDRMIEAYAEEEF
jgi:spermidine synthase